MKYSRISSNFDAKIQICLKVKFCQNWILGQKIISNFTNLILFWLQGNSLSSSRCSTPTAQVTKVTANLAFKVEVHAPHVSSPQVAEPPTRPVSSASRRSSRSSSRSSSKVSEASATGNSSVHSSLSDSLRSSLSSTSGQDYDNNGDAGFSEK